MISNYPTFLLLPFYPITLPSSTFFIVASIQGQISCMKITFSFSLNSFGDSVKIESYTYDSCECDDQTFCM